MSRLHIIANAMTQSVDTFIPARMMYSLYNSELSKEFKILQVLFPYAKCVLFNPVLWSRVFSTQLYKAFSFDRVILTNQCNVKPVWPESPLDTIVKSNLIGQNHLVNQSNSLYNWAQKVLTHCLMFESSLIFFILFY